MRWQDIRRRDFTSRQFGQVAIVIVALGFLAMMVAGGAATRAILRGQEHADWVNHTYEVENALTELRLRIERAETSRRGFLLDHDPVLRQAFDRSVRDSEDMLVRIGHLTADNPRQQRRLVELRRELARLVTAQRRSFGLAVLPGAGAEALAGFRLDDGTSTRARVDRFSTAMLDEERRLLDIRAAERRSSLRLFYGLLAVAGALLLFVAWASIAVLLRYTRDLSASRRELFALNETLEGAVAERTADLSRANAEIQRFAYIVSHDLRSPLVNVMGFTAELDTAAKAIARLIDRAEAEAPQLVDEDARLAAREDLPEAIGFIRTSTQKMDRLINAILQLSRQGRRVIAAERVDVTALAESVRDTLAHRTDELGAAIEIAPLPPIVGDRLSLEQILANLMENALKYLQPGRPGRIRVTGRTQGKRVVYEVADNGRGIDPRDHERVFDLFRRSGVQDQPGEGIGLAHVRALAYRLGGTVDLRSRLGEGATFIVTLPAVFAGEAGVTGQ